MLCKNIGEQRPQRFIRLDLGYSGALTHYCNRKLTNDFMRSKRDVGRQQPPEITNVDQNIPRIYDTSHKPFISSNKLTNAGLFSPLSQKV